MIRDEAKELIKEYAQGNYIPVFTIVSTNGFVDKIYDDIEAKKCSSCKYYKINSLTTETSMCNMWNLTVREFMSCYVWEDK